MLAAQQVDINSNLGCRLLFRSATGSSDDINMHIMPEMQIKEIHVVEVGAAVSAISGGDCTLKIRIRNNLTNNLEFAWATGYNNAFTGADTIDAVGVYVERASAGKPLCVVTRTSQANDLEFDNAADSGVTKIYQFSFGLHEGTALSGLAAYIWCLYRPIHWERHRA
jgi:hypothetical protein